MLAVSVQSGVFVLWSRMLAQVMALAVSVQSGPSHLLNNSVSSQSRPEMCLLGDSLVVVLGITLGTSLYDRLSD